MIALNRFFKNPFLDPAISNSELQAFAEDHVSKVAGANAGGELDALLTDTTAAFNGYFGELTNLSLRTATQKAATQTARQRWAEFVGWMTKKGEARIEDKAEKPSAVYTEFFPRGMAEYHESTVADGRTLAVRVKASPATHAVLLGADFKTKVDVLVDGYESARSAQMEKKGGSTDTRGSRDEAKAALQKQLFRNLLFFAEREMDPERCALFFNQSLLEDAAALPAPVVPVA